MHLFSSLGRRLTFIFEMSRTHKSCPGASLQVFLPNRTVGPPTRRWRHHPHNAVFARVSTICRVDQCHARGPGGLVNFDVSLAKRNLNPALCSIFRSYFGDNTRSSGRTCDQTHKLLLRWLQTAAAQSSHAAAQEPRQGLVNLIIPPRYLKH